MKRGKDDEKIMGPMFPRLHVNDTEKGGPRAPPRNKMALYEQLSIPSQRFNHGVNTSNPSDLVPPGSSRQGNGLERNTIFPQYVPQSKPTNVTEKLHNRCADGGSLNASLAQPERRKRMGDEDDFRVPVYQSRIGQHHHKTQAATNKVYDPNYSCSAEMENVADNDPKHIGSTSHRVRQDMRIQSEKDLEVCASSIDHTINSSSNFTTREKISAPEEEANLSPVHQCQDNTMSNLHRSCDNDKRLQRKSTAGSQPAENAHCDGVLEMVRERDRSNDLAQESQSRLTKDCNSPNEPEVDNDYCGDKTYGSTKLRDRDKSNDFSESSMLDSISALDISPDDVVGVIGQKQFWKARKAIVNQQRVFAVQVFELHRLIKVQRLIAGSPHLLQEDGAYLDRPSKVSPMKHLPLESAVAPQLHAAKQNDDSVKQNHKMERSAENAVGKTSLSSVKNGTQPSNYGPYSGNPTVVPAAPDLKMGPWCFPQPVGHQWLMPVMSPSEGLVYKPYAPPGYMGSVCGGCGPFGQTPVNGNFMGPVYGVPASPHHPQGIGGPPGAPLIAHGYFPPYGMPIMNPAGLTGEQMNYFAGYGQTGQTSGGRVDSNMQHQSSCNMPTQKNGATQVKKFQASKDIELQGKDIELQGSTGSSSSGKTQGVGTVQASEGRNTLPFSPATASAPAVAPHPQGMNQPTRVIKVVPHNRRSATESAARIFQSIQEGRVQYDSM